MKHKIQTIAMMSIIALLSCFLIWGCGGGGDDGGSSPEPTVSYSPVADYYNVVMLYSDKSLRCGVASNNDLSVFHQHEIQVFAVVSPPDSPVQGFFRKQRPGRSPGIIHIC